MPLSFYLFHLFFLLMFGQQNVLRKTPKLSYSKRDNLVSISIIIGSILYPIGIIYFGIQYSWIISIITGLSMVFLSGFTYIVLPFLYLLSPSWSVFLAAAIALEFYSYFK